jgi:hypothetical protein
MTEKRKPQPGDTCLVRMVIESTSSHGDVYIRDPSEPYGTTLPVPVDLVEHCWFPLREGNRVWTWWDRHHGVVVHVEGEDCMVRWKGGNHSVMKMRELLSEAPTAPGVDPFSL